MRPTAEVRPVDSTLTGESAEFTIIASAHAFRTLVTGIYSRKIEAVIRELCTNAFDAHRRAGRPDRPFIVGLPDRLDPTFSVRDFGQGMTHTFVMERYRSLFDSDKQDTNNEVGMLGLGAKSPYAVTDCFYLKVHQADGVTRTYVSTLNSKGIPYIQHVGDTFTSEEEGLEVSFAVDPSDFSQYRADMVKVAMGFDVRPVFNGDPGRPTWQIERDTLKAFRNGSGYATAFIRQGCVVYPIPASLARRISMPAGWTAYIDVPIGTVDVTASREELEFTPKTEEAVAAIIDQASATFNRYVIEQIDGAADDYERVLLTHTYRDWPAVRSLPKTLSVLKPQLPEVFSPNGYPIKFGSLNEHAQRIASDAKITIDQLLARYQPLWKMPTYGRNKDLTSVWEVGAQSIAGIEIVHDDGSVKIPRRKLRLLAWSKNRDARFVFSGSSTQLAVIAAYFHVSPDRITTLDKLPDVAPRTGTRGPVTAATRASTLIDTPWVQREGKVWQFPAFNDWQEAGTPRSLCDLAKWVGLGTLSHDSTLPPSQWEKADPAWRWDAMLLKAVQAQLNTDALRSAALCTTLSGGLFHAPSLNHTANIRGIRERLVRIYYPNFNLVTNRELDVVSILHNRSLIPEAVQDLVKTQATALAKKFPLLYDYNEASYEAYITERL